MKILFMGTPEFSVPSLERLYNDGHEICGVIVQPDKPKGRKMILSAPPVKECAVRLGLNVYQPVKLKNDALLPLLEQLNPDLIVVVAYGRILPDYILNFPKFGAINVHGSLLPSYRGAAPIQRSVMDCCETAGITTMYMASELDAGDIILQKSIPLEESETSGDLFEKLSLIGADLLSETVDKLFAGNAPRIPQNNYLATFAPMLSKEEGLIDWTLSAEKTAALVRGLDPWPCAYSVLDGKKIKLYRAKAVDESCSSPNGTVLAVSKGQGLLISCGGKCVCIKEIQYENGRRMNAEDFVRGHSDIIGKKFGVE